MRRLSTQTEKWIDACTVEWFRRLSNGDTNGDRTLGGLSNGDATVSSDAKDTEVTDASCGGDGDADDMHRTNAYVNTNVLIPNGYGKNC